MAAVLSDIKQVPAPELMVIGHTDSVGSDEVNDPLSLKRAEVIKELLAASGVQTLRMEAVGRGKRDPLVPVGDNVAEPKNRRVELRLR